jgi:hypothetical protein
MDTMNEEVTAADIHELQQTLTLLDEQIQAAEADPRKIDEVVLFLRSHRVPPGVLESERITLFVQRQLEVLLMNDPDLTKLRTILEGFRPAQTALATPELQRAAEVGVRKLAAEMNQPSLTLPYRHRHAYLDAVWNICRLFKLPLETSQEMEKHGWITPQEAVKLRSNVPPDDGSVDLRTYLREAT